MVFVYGVNEDKLAVPTWWRRSIYMMCEGQLLGIHWRYEIVMVFKAFLVTGQ